MPLHPAQKAINPEARGIPFEEWYIQQVFAQSRAYLKSEAWQQLREAQRWDKRGIQAAAKAISF